LTIKIIFLTKKKENIYKNKNKKIKKEIGGGSNHPLGQKWSGWTTPFLAKGVATLTTGLGVVRPPQKAKKKKKKKKNNGFWAFGGGL
jgi:hypothetical protein